MGNVGATLLPVLGGFFFLYFCHYTKFYVRRLRGYYLSSSRIRSINRSWAAAPCS